MTTKTAEPGAVTTSSRVKDLTITAICLVLVYVFTAVVNIRLPFAPNGGLIHLGNVPLFVAAILFGKRTGMIAGGIGMGLFDLINGWTAWAPSPSSPWAAWPGRGRHYREEEILPPLYPGYGPGLRHQDRRILCGRGDYLWQLDRSCQPPSPAICSRWAWLPSSPSLSSSPSASLPTTRSCGSKCMISAILVENKKDAEADSASFCNFLPRDFHLRPLFGILWDAANFIGFFSK